MITLQKIDAKNIWEIIDLKVSRAQKKFIVPNNVSIIESHIASGTECRAFAFGIYNGNRPVGFLMIGYNAAAMYEFCDEKSPEVFKKNYSIWRLMIDKRYQRKGCGKEAMRLALGFIRTWPCGRAEYCALSYEPDNEAAKNLYHSFGFAENGEKSGTETVAVLKL